MLCSLEVSHSTFGHPEPENLPRDTSTAMTLMNPFLIFVLHCHLNSRLPTTERYRCVKQASAHCRPSGWESPQTGHGHMGKAKPWCLSTGRDFGCLCASSFPGMQSWVMTWWTCRAVGGGGSRHTQTQQFVGFPAAALCYRLSGGGVPTGRQTHSRQGPRGALVNRGLWLVTHPG